LGFQRNPIGKVRGEVKKKNTVIQFFQEAKLLEVMRHPNIIQIKEFYRTKSGKLVMILEFAEGGDLQGEVDRMINENTHFKESTILSKTSVYTKFVK
jgi:serine/threonine protein kinase